MSVPHPSKVCDDLAEITESADVIESLYREGDHLAYSKSERVTAQDRQSRAVQGRSTRRARDVSDPTGRVGSCRCGDRDGQGRINHYCIPSKLERAARDVAEAKKRLLRARGQLNRIFERLDDEDYDPPKKETTQKDGHDGFDAAARRITVETAESYRARLLRAGIPSQVAAELSKRMERLAS